MSKKIVGSKMCIGNRETEEDTGEKEDKNRMRHTTTEKGKETKEEEKDRSGHAERNGQTIRTETPDHEKVANKLDRGSGVEARVPGRNEARIPSRPKPNTRSEGSNKTAFRTTYKTSLSHKRDNPCPF